MKPGTQPGIDPGCVRLRLGVAEGVVVRVEVGSERPRVAEVLRGRQADAAVRLVPLLFALCGKAQGRAAELALAAARGTDCAAHLDPASEAEAMREHLWRWLLDLPPLCRRPPLQAEYSAAVRWIASGERARLADWLAGKGIAALRQQLLALEDLTEPADGLLPTLDARRSLALWPQLTADLCRLPHCQGATAETGALARRPGAPLMPAFCARWLARLEELRDWAEGRSRVGAGGTASAAPVRPGRGRALVETARGMLMHEIVLDGEQIADYFILAPTEWNFHPQGPLKRWLHARSAHDRDALQGFAARAVAALDPCVRWELEWL